MIPTSRPPWSEPPEAGHASRRTTGRYNPLWLATSPGEVRRPVVREPAPALEQVRLPISRLDLISDLVFQRRLYDLETLREERRLREEGEAQVKAPKAEIGERGRFPGVPSSRGCRRVGGR